MAKTTKEAAHLHFLPSSDLSEGLKRELPTLITLIIDDMWETE